MNETPSESEICPDENEVDGFNKLTTNDTVDDEHDNDKDFEKIEAGSYL